MKRKALSFGTNKEKSKQNVVWLLRTTFPDVPKTRYLYFLQIRSPKHIDRIYDILTRVTLKKYGDAPFYKATPRQIYNDVISLIKMIGLKKEEYDLVKSL